MALLLHDRCKENSLMSLFFFCLAPRSLNMDLIFCGQVRLLMIHITVTNKEQMWPQDLKVKLFQLRWKTTFYQIILELFSHILKSRRELNDCVFLKNLEFAEERTLCIHLTVNNRLRITTAWRKHGKKNKHLDPAEHKKHLFVHGFSLCMPATCVSTLLSHHNACLVLDALRGTPLRTDGDPSGFHRTRRDQQNPHKHREARNAQAEGGVDISTLPDNMTRIVVRSKQILL